MRAWGWFIGLILTLLISGPAGGRTKCAPDDLTAAMVRGVITSACACGRAPGRCVRRQVNLGIGSGQLQPECRRRAVRCLLHVICGRPPSNATHGCAAFTATTTSTTTTTTTTHTTSTTNPNGFPPIDLSGTWLLRGDEVRDSCDEPDSKFNSRVTIEQNGTNLEFSGDVSLSGKAYSRWVSPTEFTLQPDLPEGAVTRPGAPDHCLYDFYVSLVGTFDPSDGSILVVQQRGYFPVIGYPECPGCSVEWMGKMERPEG